VGEISRFELSGMRRFEEMVKKKSLRRWQEDITRESKPFCLEKLGTILN